MLIYNVGIMSMPFNMIKATYVYTRYVLKYYVISLCSITYWGILNNQGILWKTWFEDILCCSIKFPFITSFIDRFPIRDLNAAFTWWPIKSFLHCFTTSVSLQLKICSILFEFGPSLCLLANILARCLLPLHVYINQLNFLTFRSRSYFGIVQD